MSDDGLARMYRMPTVFGPSAGPRNLPRDKEPFRYVRKALTISISARSEAAAIAAYLPPRCRLAGAPIVTVTMNYLTNIGWLAGRGYNIAQVTFPNVVFAGEEGEVEGGFVPVLWENMADPILTGREELGFPKIFGEIPEPIVLGNTYRCGAAWMGFRFLDLEASGLEERPATADPPRKRLLFHKYAPKTQEWGEADASYMTATGEDGPGPVVTRRLAGAGRFAFQAARWEDMPTQYHIVSALAALPLRSFTEASVVFSEGGGDLLNQRILR